MSDAAKPTSGRLCQTCLTTMRYTLEDGTASCWCGHLKEREITSEDYAFLLANLRDAVGDEE